MSISTSALLLDISFIVGGVITKNMLVALNQVVSPVNAATPSTLEIVGTLFLAGMMILALIYLVWLNISKARERVEELGRLDAMAICHILCTLCLLLPELKVVDFIASVIRVSSQVSPVNAATPSTLEIIGTLFLVGILILILIYAAWLNISYTIQRAQLDVLTIHDVVLTFCILLLDALVLFRGVNIMCFYLSLL